MKGRRYILIVWLLLAGGMIGTSCGDNQHKRIADESKNIAEENNEDKFNSGAAERNAQMVVNVAALGHAELEMAKAAKTKSKNKTIKNLAASLQADQTLLMKQLKQFAANRNISVPDSATEADRREAMKMAENNSSSQFDREWCKELLNKHEMMIAEMEEAATTATDPALRAWINDALPKIRVHRDKLMQIKYKF